MFKIKFAGTGSAFNTQDYQTNILIQKNDKNFLIDCGSMAPFSLPEAIPGFHNGNIHEKLDGIYISHLHGDHCGGLEWIGFCTYFNPVAPPIKLYSSVNVIYDLWENVLKGAMETLEGKVAHMTDFFDCKPIKENAHFEWEGIRFTPVQTVHVVSGWTFQNSYGLLLQEHPDSKKPGKKVYITTDTQFAPVQMRHFYAEADEIYHDCSTAFEDPVHASYNQLNSLEPEIKEKMYLCHYQPNPPQFPVKDGFKGFVQKGEEYIIK